MSETRPGLRKRLLGNETAGGPDTAGAIDLVSCATLGFSSEDSAHPIDNLIDGTSGPGATQWRSAQPNVTERIVVEFDRPQPISRLLYEVEETERERTQEVHVEVSEDGGETYRRVLVQEFTFSPGGATFQQQDQRLEAGRVSHIRLTIVPNKSGSGTATLSTLRLFA